MQLKVRCRCQVTRTIDTGKVGPFRLRCKQCGDVLFDPRAEAAEPVVLDDRPGVEDSTFFRRLQESAEIKVLMSSDGEESPPCPKHPDRRVVAACTRCSRLLCKRCLDRIDDDFVCSSCVAEAAGAKPPPGGLMAWFRRVLGG